MFVAMVCTKLADLYGILGNISAVCHTFHWKQHSPEFQLCILPLQGLKSQRTSSSFLLFFNSWHLAIQKQSITCINIIYIYQYIYISYTFSCHWCLMMSYVKMQIIPIFVQTGELGSAFCSPEERPCLPPRVREANSTAQLCLACVMPCTGLVLVRVVPVVCLLSREWWQRCALNDRSARFCYMPWKYHGTQQCHFVVFWAPDFPCADTSVSCISIGFSSAAGDLSEFKTTWPDHDCRNKQSWALNRYAWFSGRRYNMQYLLVSFGFGC